VRQLLRSPNTDRRRSTSIEALSQPQFHYTSCSPLGVTNSTLTAIAADETHRNHAIIEQVIAELKDGPLAHAPSGKFTLNAAWVTVACLAFNILRAVGAAAGARHAKTRWATLRTHLIDLPARIASTARRLVLHLPPTGPHTGLGRPLDHRHHTLTTRLERLPVNTPTVKNGTGRPTCHALEPTGDSRPGESHERTGLRNHPRWVRAEIAGLPVAPAVLSNAADLTNPTAPPKPRVGDLVAEEAG